MFSYGSLELLSYECLGDAIYGRLVFEALDRGEPVRLELNIAV